MDKNIYTIETDELVIEASLSNPTYKGEAGKTPVKGVDYFTPEDISEIAQMVQIEGEIPTKLSDLDNDMGFITSFTETDPTVPNWAKQPSKPEYTASEVGAIADTAPAASITQQDINNWNTPSVVVETDPTVPAWAKESTKPSYTASEVGAMASNHPAAAITANDISSWNNKSDFSGSYNDLTDKPTISSLGNLVDGIATGSLRGINTHIEDSGNTLGQNAVAIGQSTVATGNDSFAEGYDTRAQAAGAHAEGNSSYANGQYSHAEGKSTIAYGKYSHTEGEETVANTKSQHVFGEYNITDGDSFTDHNNRGIYVEIVGNGTSSVRSNARTLDWSGNEKLAGKLTLGAVGVNSMDAATVGQLPSYTAGDGVDITNNEVNVLVDGSTIDFDSNNQLTVLGGGGTTYTAGDGINIDANNVLSTTQKPVRVITTTSINGSGYSADDKAYIINAINSGIDNYPFVIDISNYGNVMRYFPVGSNSTQIKMLNIENKHMVNIGYNSNNNMLAFSFTNLNGSFFASGLTAANAPSGTASNTIGQELTYIKNNYATKTELPKGLPTDPLNDGTYFLKTVVSSGTPTYSWESVIVGGTY